MENVAGRGRVSAKDKTIALVLAVALVVAATGIALAYYQNIGPTVGHSSTVCTNGATNYPSCNNNICQNGGTYPNCNSSLSCKGKAACFRKTVTHIVDGDTLDVGSTRIRLALVNTPEVGQPGYQEGKDFTAQTCPVGSQAIVDQDDGQTAGSYGRMVAVVYCGDVNLNAALLSSGLAELVTYYCSVSEFASESWTGCP